MDQSPHQEDNRLFSKHLFDQLPLLDDVYNYLVYNPNDDVMYNLGVSPLYRTMLTRPFSVTAHVEEHSFLGYTDHDVYMVPYLSAYFDTYGIDAQQIILSKGVTLKSITYYTKYNADVMDDCDMMICYGALYKKLHNQWKKINLS